MSRLTPSHERLRTEGEELEPWVQFNYVMYASHRRTDDAVIKAHRQELQKNGLSAVALPEELPVSGFSAGDTYGGDEWHEAHFTRHLNAEFLRKPCCPFYVSEDPVDRKFPYINGHTIPDDFDGEFEQIRAEICQVGPCSDIPSYQDVVDRMDRYVSWFDGRSRYTP